MATTINQIRSLVAELAVELRAEARANGDRLSLVDAVREARTMLTPAEAIIYNQWRNGSSG